MKVKVIPIDGGSLIDKLREDVRNAHQEVARRRTILQEAMTRVVIDGGIPANDIKGQTLSDDNKYIVVHVYAPGENRKKQKA